MSLFQTSPTIANSNSSPSLYPIHRHLKIDKPYSYASSRLSQLSLAAETLGHDSAHVPRSPLFNNQRTIPLHSPPSTAVPTLDNIASSSDSVNTKFRPSHLKSAPTAISFKGILSHHQQHTYDDSPHLLERRWTDTDFSSEPVSFAIDLDYTAAFSSSLPSTSGITDEMSTLAVQYDPSYTGLGTRPSYSWPASLESGNIANHVLSIESMNNSSLGSGSSSSRSFSTSPPRPTLSPEQRDVKRHTDLSRHDIKNSLRIRRTNSHPYGLSPPTLSANTTSIGLSMYSAPPASAPILAGSSAASITPSYMSGYSPALPEPSSATTYNSSHYTPSIGHSYSLSVDYPSSFSSASSYSSNRPASMSNMFTSPSIMTPSSLHSEDGHVRMGHSRPRPQCWDHGCNGRQFSTFSNLLRHQREKSGQATKSVCPQCGQSFTRSTARNGHLQQNKCRGRGSDSSGSDHCDDGMMKVEPSGSEYDE